MATVDGLVPVTILTGFLGSGKTTLLNHILTATHGKKIAIIENEFGEVGIDDALLASNAKAQAAGEEIIEMLNGCVCCTVRGDLIKILKTFSDRVTAGTLRLDAIIIETTGMADPAPVAQTFFVDDDVKSFAQLDGIVTLVDAKHIEQHLDEEKPEGVENESLEQVAFADRILLNKIDLVSEADLTRIEARLRSVNKVAPIQRCTKSQVSVDGVLNIRGFDVQRVLEMDPEFLNTDGEHIHDTTVSSLCITIPGDVDFWLLQIWLEDLLANKAKDIFRMKGVLAIAHAEERFVHQAVHMMFTGDKGEPWGEEPRVNKLVFIGRNLDHAAMRSSFEACLATPENIERKRQSLRFSVGDRVQCLTQTGWVSGKVVSQLYREEGMDPGVVAPYQIEIDDGSCVSHFDDYEQTICKA